MEYKEYSRLLKISRITNSPLTGEALDIYNRSKEILDNLYMEIPSGSYDTYFTHNGIPLFNIVYSKEMIDLCVLFESGYNLCIIHIVLKHITGVSKFEIRNNLFISVLYGVIKMESKEKYEPRKLIK
jgi:hypothetical protein